jgi:hypothetical protein
MQDGVGLRDPECLLHPSTPKTVSMLLLGRPGIPAVSLGCRCQSHGGPYRLSNVKERLTFSLCCVCV